MIDGNAPRMKKKVRSLRSTAQAHSLSRVGGIGFPIVGIGASAGGLEAFTQLLKRLPLDTGMGFVLVQHLDPQHDSALTQILARATAMPVHEAMNNLRVQPNHVYVIPPNTSLGIANGVLKLRARLQNRLTPRSIDFFFETLAQDRHERAIGVILSGTATDGTLGLEAIKGGGGITFAQDDSAKFDSMPRSAVDAGCVDFTLSPEAIAKELTHIARHPAIAGQTSVPKSVTLPARGGAPAPALPEEDGKSGYQKILLLLRNHSGVDFSLYKTPTIHRRITRRTVLNKHATPEAYADFLKGNTKELDALYADALINVTSFFRNTEAFAVLQRKVFPKLLHEVGDDPVRVWVLGCSTGQEAYSIAMAFAEVAEKIPRARKLQVFATDLNEANLVKARYGLYPKNLAHDISPERLRRFFIEEEGGYRVIKSLRESVVFARQNLISDPPFSRMDIISCRNLMIYLEPSLQKKLLPTFHYALKPGGFLFLGASESVGGFTELFGPVDKKYKIFARKAAPTPTFHLPVRKEREDRPVTGPASHPVLTAEKSPGAPANSVRVEPSAEREADRVTVNQFAPPSVLINANLQILQFRGPTGAYLQPPTGKASFDLLKMAREGLMLPLRAAINKAKLEHKTIRKENVALKHNGKTRLVHVEVVPLKNLKERCFLVLFEEANRSARNVADAAELPESFRPVAPQVESSRILGLERDLADTRDYLQSIEEEQEAANEELQASNEEGQSANEELQSLNEELETSKEELESTNEELTTVNEEMVNRNTELNRLNSDLINFQASTHLIIMLLGRDLTIRHFSPQAKKQLHLVATDLGRPLGNVRLGLAIPDLEAFVAEVISSVREEEREVQDRDGRWYSLRVRPYINAENKVDGAVLVLVDINASKEAAQAVIHTRDFAEAIIGTVRDPFLILDAEFRVQKANQAFLKTFKVSPTEAVDCTVFELDHGQWDIPGLRKLLKDILPRHTSFNDFEITHNFSKLGRRTLLLNARKLSQGRGHREKILLGIKDVTEQLRIQAHVRQSELRYRRLFESAQDGILMLDPKTRKITEANPYIVKLLGYSREQLIQKELWQIGLIKDEAASRAAFRELKAKGVIRYENLPLLSKSGQHHEVEFVSNLYKEGDEQVIQCNIRDITDRKGIETALMKAQTQIETYSVQLESKVTARTKELTVANQRLLASLKSINEAKEKYRSLLEASQFMQKKLRHLARQILTAQEDERRKISRELHDVVVQTLVGINVELAALGAAANLGARPLKAKIAHTQRLVEKSVNAVHQFARELRPAVLDDLGLIPALHAFLKTVASRAKLKISLTAFAGVEALSNERRTVLYRVAQEALTNVVRHAQASVVKVSIREISGAVCMEVHDNGKSFQVPQALSPKTNKRLGLLGMRERVEMIGGLLNIASAPGQGTTVRAEIPLREKGHS
jgi:two-component system CheB/CheR fusion protein